MENLVKLGSDIMLPITSCQISLRQTFRIGSSADDSSQVLGETLRKMVLTFDMFVVSWYNLGETAKKMVLTCL